jgi:uncharacterized protein with ATP-grasp and redox domains
MKTIAESVKLATDDKMLQRKIFFELIEEVKNYTIENPPPEIAGDLYRKVKAMTGNNDPYRDIKKYGNDLMLKYADKFRDRIKNSKDRLLTALELSIAGNIIDYGINPNIDVEKVINKILKDEAKTIKKENNKTFDYENFKQDLSSAKSLLFLCDNCGEIILDMLMLEEIKKFNPAIEINIAVRDSSILNDVTMEDAKYCGLDKIGNIFSSGSDYPGVMLKRCNQKFLDIFYSADIVLSKGQGNFETLDEKKGRKIYYLFMAKCPIVVDEIEKLVSKCNLMDIILAKN